MKDEDEKAGGQEGQKQGVRGERKSIIILATWILF